MAVKSRETKLANTAKKVANRKLLKKGDKVIVIAGGHEKKRDNKGKVGAILKFVAVKGKKPVEGSIKVVVEGLNLVVKHKKATSATDQGGKIIVPAPIHISNVMYYAEKEKRGVRLTSRVLEDGRKVRGYISKESREFVQV